MGIAQITNRVEVIEENKDKNLLLLIECDYSVNISMK